MRLIALKLVSILALASSAGGCFPATHYDVPAIHGRIVNSALQPIAGAQVRLVQTQGQGHRDITILTRTDGVFSRPADSRFYIASPLPFEMGWVVTCEVTATDGVHHVEVGKAQSTFNTWFEKPYMNNVDFGTVVLK